MRQRDRAITRARRKARSHLLYQFPLALFLLSYAANSVKDEWCLERGLDPSNLPCDTCDLLGQSPTLARLSKEKGVDLDYECRQCCASYKANPLLRPDASLKGKYRHALLTYDDMALQVAEFRDFVEQDLSDIISAKEKRLNSVKVDLDADGSMMDQLAFFGMGGMGGFGGGTVPKLFFFEKDKPGGYSEEDEDEASEVIPLRGWKREDLKDMLTTLL